MTLLALLVAGSLLAIAGLHLYWGVGGRWGASATLPKKADGSLLFLPGLAACFVVATGLCAMAWVVLTRQQVVASPLTMAWSLKLHWAFAAIFALRCLGDFRYMGLFRQVRETDFAVMDTKFFTPLCAFYVVAFVTLAQKK